MVFGALAADIAGIVAVCGGAAPINISDHAADIAGTAVDRARVIAVFDDAFYIFILSQISHHAADIGVAVFAADRAGVIAVFDGAA